MYVSLTCVGVLFTFRMWEELTSKGVATALETISRYLLVP